jgi:FtsH-binding integral membrane protein
MDGLLTKEFFTMLVGLAVAVLVALVPQLEASKTELISAIMVIVSVLLATFGGEKIAAARASGSTEAERATVRAESLKVKS